MTRHASSSGGGGGGGGGGGNSEPAATASVACGEQLSAFDAKHSVQLQERSEKQATVRLLDKEALASAKTAAVQMKAIADTTRGLRATMGEHAKLAAAVDQLAVTVRAAEQVQEASLVVKRAAAASELVVLRKRQDQAQRASEQRCRQLKEKLAREKPACDQEQKELRANILQSKKALLADSEQADAHAAVTLQQKESRLKQLRDDSDELGDLRLKRQRLIQESGERKQRNEGRLKAIVAAHPNSQESLWRAKLRTKREQLEELKRMAAA